MRWAPTRLALAGSRHVLKIVEVNAAAANIGVTQCDEFVSASPPRGIDRLTRNLRGRVDDLRVEAARD